MSIKIGAIIKELRASRGITQDQLATFLGVTPQAISRWESQNGYPDIEVLPMIADFFSVSVDELLGRDLDEKEQRRAEIYKKIKENCELGLGPEAIPEARLFAAEFPADEIIQENLADCICRAYMWEQNPDLGKLAEADRIYQTLLATTRDSDFRNNILESMACLYAVAFKDKYKLEQTVNQLPLMAYSREAVGANAMWEFDRSIVRKQDYIEKLTDSLGTELEWYVIKCMDNAPEMWDTKIALLEKIIELYYFVFGENMLCYHSRVAGLHRIIATYKVAQKKYDETLDCLEKMLYHIKQHQAVKTGDRYESPFMTEMEAYVDLPGLGEFDKLEVHNDAWYILNGRLTQSRYDPIREMPRFVKIMEELSAIAE